MYLCPLLSIPLLLREMCNLYNKDIVFIKQHIVLYVLCVFSNTSMFIVLV